MVNVAWTVILLSITNSKLGISKQEEIEKVHDEGSQKVSNVSQPKEKKRFPS